MKGLQKWGEEGETEKEKKKKRKEEIAGFVCEIKRKNVMKGGRDQTRILLW